MLTYMFGHWGPVSSSISQVSTNAVETHDQDHQLQRFGTCTAIDVYGKYSLQQN